MLHRAAQLLGTGAHTVPLDHSSQRRALFEGAWLAVADANQGDLERACSIGRVAVERVQTVHSRRSTDVLHILARQLRRRTRNEHVADFLPVLDNVLAGAAPRP